GLTAEDDAARERWLIRAEQYVTDAKGESPSHPRILSQSGRVKLARGQDRLALQDLRKADEAYGAFDTVNWENKIILAQVHLRLNEAGAAKDVLESVLEHAAKWRGADPLFWNLYAQILFQNNELDRAMAVSDRILLVNPADANAKQLKAAIFERQGKHADAGRIHQELTGSPAVSALLGARAALLDGDVEQALEILRRALEVDPADARLVSATVHEMINRDRHEEAQAVVARALQAKPDDRRIAKLGVLTRRDLTEEQRDQAMLELNQTADDAFERDLDLIGFYSRKNDLQQTLHWISDAEQHLVAKDTPLARSATATQHRALLKAKVRAAAQVNDTAAMEAARDAAVKYNVDGAGGKSILGWYHLQRREYDLALNALREAVQAQPTDASSFTHLGQCLQVLGRADEAQGAYEQAVRLNPNEGVAHYGLAYLALSRDDKETFQKELAICERLIPSEPWVQEQVLVRTEETDPTGA
ncbi:MAG: tetratricopeptide repeat protein, partial [Planctomycetota bacterium]